MNELCDLHIHSCRSDGTCTPTELVHMAQALGLGAIALCDHNTLDGLPEFLEAAAGTPVRAVPGIELSSDYKGTELHILGLFIAPQHYSAMEALLEKGRRWKEESNLELTQALNRAGYSIDYEAVKARTKGQPNRVHFALELIEKGYISSVREGCLTVLSPENGLYHPPRRPAAEEVIRFLNSIDAAAVLAHPFLNLKEAQLLEFLPQAVGWGLHGMETLYSTFTPELTEKAQSLALRFSLAQSGGSDFHGANKPDIAMGTGRGNLRIPISFLTGLEARAR